MILFDRIAFNILLNATLSFLGGLLIVWIVIAIFRIKSPMIKLYFFSLPFIKVVCDVARGIPPDSYVWSDLNFYLLPANFYRTLSAVVGLSEFGPRVSLSLAIHMETSDDKAPLYSISLADAIYTWLAEHIGRHPVSGLILLILLISVLLVVRRLIAWQRFERRRRSDRIQNGIMLSKVHVGKRSVDIYVTPTYVGSPFTGGLLHPYICFPAQTYAELDDMERQAVIDHELMHVRHFDLIQSLSVSLLGDLFWYIPLYRRVASKMEDLRELVADRSSVSHEENAASLASALVKVKQGAKQLPKGAMYSAFSKRPSLTSRRVRQLLELDHKPSLCSLSCRFGKGLLVGVVTGFVMSSSLVGNYQINQGGPITKYLKELFEQVTSG